MYSVVIHPDSSDSVDILHIVPPSQPPPPEVVVLTERLMPWVKPTVLFLACFGLAFWIGGMCFFIAVYKMTHH